MVMASILINIINMKSPNAGAANWITAAQARVALGVAAQTLYAYVSRGLVAAMPAPGNPRRSLYSVADITALAERKGRGRSRRAVAASTLHWGEPVLASGITRITGGGFAYRGQDAVALAETNSLEMVAALLWQSSLPAAIGSGWPHAAGAAGAPEGCLAAVANIAALGRWAAAPAMDEAFRITAHMAWAAAGQSGALPEGAAGPLHVRLAESWGGDAATAEAIRRALVLVADHELNTSAYAARVVASTRAPLGACVLAGLAALTGPLHGGMTEGVRALLADPAIAAEPEAALTARLARGERVPGFGHPLYPQGDPRAQALLAALPDCAAQTALLATMRRTGGLAPNIDFALVALEQRLALPHGAAFAIFATGRTVGWIAHALEQWRDGGLIRPRAVFRDALSSVSEATGFST